MMPERSASNIVRQMLKDVGMSQSALARDIGMLQQVLNRKLVHNTMSADEFIEIVKKLGFHIEYIPEDRPK